MALALTAFAIGLGFGLSRLAFDIPASSGSANARGPIWTARSVVGTKVMIGVLQNTLSSVNSASFPNDSDEQDYDTAATINTARDSRSACRLDGVNYVFNRQSPTGIRVLNDDGSVSASNIVNISSVNGEMAETLVSNAMTGLLYAVENVNSTTNNIVEIDPINATRTIKYVSNVLTPHIAFNGAGDRIYLATNDTAVTNFRVVELAYPAFTLIQSHLIGNFTVEAILCYNPPSGADPFIVAQYYTGSVSQFWLIDLATNVATSLTSGSIAGDGMNVDANDGTVAFLTQRNEVYKLTAPTGGSFTDSVIPTPPGDGWDVISLPPASGWGQDCGELAMGWTEAPLAPGGWNQQCL